VLLVIACPCALVIATPVTVVSGWPQPRRGILIKGGVYLEEARKLRAIALDKTGTITEGKPRLVATEVLPATEPESGVARGQPGRAFGPSGLEGDCNRPSFRKTA
jgi:Cd2+/Zn2+-exporting ATPase